MIDFDELRKMVAIRHNVLLGKDDPILVTVTLHDIVLGRYVEVLTAQNEGHQKALTAALHTHMEQSKSAAGRVITDAAEYVSGQAQQAVMASLAEARSQLRQDIAEARGATLAVNAVVQTAQAARTTGIATTAVAIICALISLVAMAVVILK